MKLRKPVGRPFIVYRCNLCGKIRQGVKRGYWRLMSFGDWDCYNTTHQKLVVYRFCSVSCEHLFTDLMLNVSSQDHYGDWRACREPLTHSLLGKWRRKHLPAKY